MTSHHRSMAPRIWLLLSFVLLLIATHVPTGSAQGVPDPAGRTYLAVLEGTTTFTTITVSPKAVLHTPEGIFHGRDGIDEFSSDLRSSFSDLTFVVRESSISGDEIVIHFVMTGTHTGLYHGNMNSCAGVKVPGLAVLRMDEHGISEQWITYDQQTLLEQIDRFEAFDSRIRSDCPRFNPEVPVKDPKPSCIRRGHCRSDH